MKGAIEQAQELRNEHPNSWIPNQFENEANPDIHRRTTAQGIISDFPDGIAYLVIGGGTGGHITGCAKVLNVRFPNLT
jgi:cysteine synthase